MRGDEPPSDSPAAAAPAVALFRNSRRSIAKWSVPLPERVNAASKLTHAPDSVQAPGVAHLAGRSNHTPRFAGGGKYPVSSAARTPHP